MKTEILRVNPTEPEPAIIRRAADVLRSGGLVAFPTETVYGLGARACDATAVAKIFAAKGRPANNPLIVHLARISAGETENPPWPDIARRLAARYWPGPLTMVLPKPANLPDIITGGGRTWAIRVPDHAVAHALLWAAGPLAAPSANVSSTVSPTTAEHVMASLDGKIEMVLDGGPCLGGIESTVIDLTTLPPRVLRPGPIRPSELRALVGDVRTREVRAADEEGPLPSPGTSIRHYAPRATLECYADVQACAARFGELCGAGPRINWLQFVPFPAAATCPNGQICNMPLDAATYATVMYDTLHSADRAGAQYIVLDLPPDNEEWLAVRDRLRRAATVWRE